jgi:hypothetical protein
LNQIRCSTNKLTQSWLATIKHVHVTLSLTCMHMPHRVTHGQGPSHIRCTMAVG